MIAMYKPWFLFVVAVLLDTLGTTLFKYGTNQLIESTRSGWRGHIDNILAALKRKEIVGGVLVYIIEYVIWIGVLSTMPLSIAFPLSSVTIVLILLSSVFFLGEKVGKNRWLGGLLIITGMCLLGGQG